MYVYKYIYIYIYKFISSIIRVRKREYRRPLFYCWRFVAVAVASKNGIRCFIFCFWESSLHKFVASSLQVLCISCKLLASSLQVLCKFLVKFLAKSLQEFSAGGENVGKVRPTNQQIRSQIKPIWPRASARGTRKSTKI